MVWTMNYLNTPQIYHTNPVVEKTIYTYGNVSCSGTNLNFKDYYIYYLIRNKSEKEEILNLFSNEVFFDKDDELAAEKEIERLAVPKQDNFYDYYA